MVQQVFQPDAPWYLVVGTAIGVLAGAVQFLGLIRWPFLVPSLADMYTDPESTQATRDGVAVVFQAFHRYAGMAIGEHLGFLLYKSRLVPRALSLIGLVGGPLLIAG